MRDRCPRRRQHDRARAISARRAAVFLAAAALAPSAAYADATYIGPTGLWSDWTNWDTGWVPGESEIAYLIQSGTDPVTATFDDSAFTSNLAGFIVDYTGGVNGGSVGFTQISNVFSTTYEQVGVDGAGSISLFGGTHTISGAGSNALYVGFNPGSSGTVTLNGGDLSITDSIYIG